MKPINRKSDNNASRFRNSSLLAIALTLLAIILPGLVVIVVDPFRVYHESLFTGTGYSTIQRYQNAGLINTYLDADKGYDSIVIGSSTAANYYPEEVSSILGWGKTLNLSLNGGSPYEDRHMARYALQTGRVRHVIWDIHTLLVASPPDMLTDQAKLAPMPLYLYNNNPFDDYPYIFNFDNLLNAIQLLRGDFTAFNHNMNRAGTWYDNAVSNKQFDTFHTNEYAKSHLMAELPSDNQWKIPSQHFSPEQFTYESIDKNILEIVLPYCGKEDIDITLFFSPIARIKYAHLLPDRANMHFFPFMRLHILDNIRNCKNIRLFAFDNLDWISADRSNYMDMYHYDITVNRYILNSFARNENRLLPENIDVYTKEFHQKIEQYPDIIRHEVGDPAMKSQ